MDQNTSSPSDRAASPGGLPVGPGGLPVGLEGLAAAIDGLAADDLNQLGGALLAAQVLAMRRLLDQAEADWLRRLAAADATAPPAPNAAPKPCRPRAGCAP